VYENRWFIEKGEPISEGKPVKIKFTQRVLDSQVNMESVVLDIWCDETSNIAPTYRNDNCRSLVRLKADLSQFSLSDLRSSETAVGGDGKTYYLIKGAIEATFYSASTKYVLSCKGKRCDTVTAEYA
jgi:hypothetical protein